MELMQLRKEQMKTVILVLLILNCLQLTGQIWFNKKLWPSGYNFFNSVAGNPVVSAIIKSLPFARGGVLMSDIYANAVAPQKIVINGGNAREVYYPGQKQYGDASEVVGNVMTKLLETASPRSAEIPADDWHAYLKGKSIYVDYGFSMDWDSFANSFGYGAGAAFSGAGQVSDILITGDSVTKEGIVCLYDAAANTVTKYWVDYTGEALLKYIEAATFGKRQNRVFAFELNLDGASDSPGIKRSVLLNSLVLLLVKDDESANEIAVSNPLRNETAVFDRIVAALDYTPSSLRKSVTKEGIASYVENSATIRISPGGVIEYRAVEAGKGILLSGSGEPSQLVSSVIQVANAVWRAAGEDRAPEIRLASDLVAARDGVYHIRLNYNFAGTPVVTRIDGDEPINNAVYAYVQNGYLTSFKMVLRTFEALETTAPLMTAISAIDSLAARYGGGQDKMIVDDLFECYSSEGDSRGVMWGVKIAGSNDVVTVTE
jgi:hypothetical protein